MELTMVKLKDDPDHMNHIILSKLNGVAVASMCEHVPLDTPLVAVCASEGKPKPSEMCVDCLASLEKVYLYSRGILEVLAEGVGT